MSERGRFENVPSKMNRNSKCNPMKKSSFLSCLSAVLIMLPIALSGQAGEQSPQESITEAEMRDHIYFLASDYMKGRVGPSPEYEIAAQYVASQFAQAGLEPIQTELECMDGFFQLVPFEKGVYSADINWIMQTSNGEKEFLHNKDFKVLEDGIIPDAPLEVVFAGYGIEEPDHGWNDFEDIDIEHKMVVVLSGAPLKKGKPVLPEALHKEYTSMQGLQKKAMPVIMKNPAAIILALDPETASMVPFGKIPSSFTEINYTYTGPTEDGNQFRIPMVYLVRDEVLQALFEGQKFGPADMEEKGMKKYRCYQLEDIIVDTRFPLKEKSELTLKNVVGMVKGSDPELSKEVIVVGAHLDHVVGPGGQVNNGADDNASGSAGVMEIAEAVAMDPPKRSVVFVTYTAEEMGLYGSHFFVNSGPFDIGDMKFNVNLDMIGRTTKENSESGSHYLVANETYMPKIKPFIEEINAKELGIPLIYDTSHSGSSDHANFQAAGIPAFFFFSGVHRDLHTPGDDPEKIEYEKAVRLAKLAYQVTMQLATMDAVPAFRAEVME